MSAISVSVSAHRSSSPYQSALRRESRETSIPSTIPTRPSPTSATSCWNSSRRSVLSAERDRSLDELVLALATLDVVLDLRHRRLADIHARLAVKMLTLNLVAHRCSFS